MGAAPGRAAPRAARRPPREWGRGDASPSPLTVDQYSRTPSGVSIQTFSRRHLKMIW
jgi:hypothetical protein